MKERLYRILNIKHSESSQVFDLLTVQFFIGLANALVSVIALTLFVYNLSVSSLPMVYLVMAGLLILLNFIYEKLEHKISPLQLLKYIIGFGAVLLLVLWAGLSFGNRNDFIFILLVSSVLIYMVTGYAFWGLVSLLFNVRESRRVFSIVGSGDIPAKLIGYVITPLLIPFIGLSNLLWLAILSFCTGFILFGRFIKKKGWETIRNKPHIEHHHEKHSKRHDLVAFFFKHKLIFVISLLSIISYNVFILIDYTFILQVKLKFENITDLAAYISLFFAFGRLIALGFKLIFTSRVIEKLGVIYCLLITPIALFLFCLLFFINGDHSTYNLFIFGLMAMLTEVLRSTMQEPVFLILFQPLKENLRLKGHIISKGYMYPPALIIVGLSLIFLNSTGTQVSIMLAVKAVILNLCIWAGIIFFLRRTYLNTIHASIKKGIFNSEEIFITDQQTVNILLGKIETGKRIEVIYALNLLENSGYAGFDALLQKQVLEGKDVEVKKYALDRMESLEKVNVDTLRNMLNEVNDDELEQKIVSLLCKYDEEFLERVSENISANEEHIRKIIIINLLNHREFKYLFIAGQEINRLLYSGTPGERELAVSIISELKNVQFSAAIEQLINDEEISVQRVAITAACKLRMEKLLPLIIDLLDQPAHKNIVLKGLQVYGDILFEDIKHRAVNIQAKYMTDLIKLAGKTKGEHSTSFLVTMINVDDGLPKDNVLHSLWLKEYEPVGAKEKDRFCFILNNYLKSGLEKIQDYNHVPDLEQQQLIKRSIFNEVRTDLQAALKACAILFRNKAINRILELLEIAKQEKLYNAMEMLELVLPKKISKDINLLFDFVLDPYNSSRIAVKIEIKAFYHKAIFNAPLLYNPWTKAVCIYSCWKNNEIALLIKLKDHIQKDDHYLVQETMDFVKEEIGEHV
ncbi:MAG: hypothetical protein ABIN36_08000 [Ferruginibacter sp.]